MKQGKWKWKVGVSRVIKVDCLSLSWLQLSIINLIIFHIITYVPWVMPTFIIKDLSCSVLRSQITHEHITSSHTWNKFVIFSKPSFKWEILQSSPAPGVMSLTPGASLSSLEWNPGRSRPIVPGLKKLSYTDWFKTILKSYSGLLWHKLLKSLWTLKAR